MDEEMIRVRVIGMMRDVEQAGFERGLREGISRLEMLAAVVPSSVTKAWFVEQANREAKTLWRKLPNPKVTLDAHSASVRSEERP